MRKITSVTLMALSIGAASPAQAVLFGRVVSDSLYPAVRRVDITEANGRAAVCTGVFVGPRTMLTAAHCATAAGATQNTGQGASLRLSVGGTKATGYAVPRQYYSSPDGSRPNDLAVIQFPRDFSNPYVSISKSAPEVGSPLTLVGFGLGDTEGDVGTKRAGSASLSTRMFGQLALQSASDQVPPPAALAEGDSGGPLFDAIGCVVGTAVNGSRHRVGSSFISSAVDLSDPGIRLFLKNASATLGEAIPSLAPPKPHLLPPDVTTVTVTAGSAN